MLLLPESQLQERRRLTAEGGPLAPLLESLMAELEPLLGREPYLPRDKALLTRAGGRCEADGTALTFDPYSPASHECPRCGARYGGEVHHRAWITYYQLWLAERAVHAALFHRLRGQPRHAALARDILNSCADAYLEYPNVDNVLGPSRPFFSTYLESIWLLQICLASDLLAAGGDTAVAEVVRDRILEPSRSLISQFDESMSNRQVWNNAAMLAAALLCRDESAADRALLGPSGLHAHLAAALLDDGTWYEGENYHQFALRGLWYGVLIAEGIGKGPGAAHVDRFHRAFAAPFLTALPDFTMPSRKDSQYAVSLRQWRLAELAELGFARTRDPLLARALHTCYEPHHPPGPTGRATSAADVERNGPAVRLTRADLGWRALLCAVGDLPACEPAQPRSVHLPSQGYAVFRRSPDIYVGVDYGQSGGGHGHPDRLNLTLYEGPVRWLDDMGTGSYVESSLHWYRSTLAHNAPMIDGRSQPMRGGALLAYAERGAIGWISALLDVPDAGVELTRSVVVAPDYMIDELKWTSGGGEHRVELPLHLDGDLEGPPLQHATLRGEDGSPDGFAFLSDVRSADVAAGECARISAVRDGRSLHATVFAERGMTVYSASCPGQPPNARRRLFLFRCPSTPAQPGGTLRSVMCWGRAARSVTVNAEEVVIEYSNGERHSHRRAGHGWRVDLATGDGRSSIDLPGERSPVAAQRMASAPAAVSVPFTLHRSEVSPGWFTDLDPGAAALRFELGQEHYRRSEVDWRSAGCPAAGVAMVAAGNRLVALVQVRAGDLAFVPAGADNPFDNEHPDTLGAGVQLFARGDGWAGAWTLVPEVAEAPAVRVRRVHGHGVTDPVARWRKVRAGGYEVRLELPLPGSSARNEYLFSMDLIVNETVAGRRRRRGQLVLSGAHGEFVYLRGDRQDDDRYIRVRIVP